MAWEDAYNSIMNPVVEESSTSSTPYALEDRGFLSGTASGIARGFVDAASTIGAGLEQAGFDNSIRSGVKYAKENLPFLMPDIPEAFGMDTGVYGAVKRLPQQLTSSVAGTLGGGVIGGLVAGPAGAVVGSAGAMITQFGLGIKREKTEEYLAKNPGDYDGAENYSNIYAASELGFELASNAFAALTFGTSKLLTGVAKAGVKATAREMLQFSGKELVKDTLMAGGVEMASEMATYGAESAADVSYGMGGGISEEGLTETAVTTAGMSLIFAAVGAKYQHSQRTQLKSMLENGTQEQQTAAANLISKELVKEGDPDLAGAWDSYTSSSISNNIPISLNDKFVELGNKINNVDIKVEDITSSNPDIQKNAVDKILRDSGIGEDGGPVQTPTLDFGIIFEDRTMREESSSYNKDRIIGTEASRQANDRILKKQSYDARRAELQLSQVNPVEDPVTVLENMYNEQEAAAKKKEMEEVYKSYNPSAPKSPEIIQWEKDQAIAESETYAANNRKSILSRLSPEVAQRIVELRQSKEVAINTLMQEVLPNSNNLPAIIKEAEVVVEKSIKGSKKQKQAKEVVKVAKAMQTAQKEIKATPAPVVEPVITPTPTVAPAAVTEAKAAPTPIVETPIPIVEPVAANPNIRRRKAADKVVAPRVVSEPTVEPTIADTEKLDNVTIASMDNTKGVEVAQMETPETALLRKEAEKATLEERKALEAKDEVEEAMVPELKEAVAKANDPILSAVATGDTTTLNSLFPPGSTGPKKAATILASFQKLGMKVVGKHITDIKKIVDKAMEAVTIEDTKNKKGAKASDAIRWPIAKTGVKVTKEEGVHKTTGQKVLIEKHSENVKGKRVALWDVVVDGKKVAEVEGQVAARKAAENYVTPLTKEELTAARKISSTRSGTPLSKEEKDLVARYESSKKINRDKVKSKEEKVADVIKIDPKTGKATVVPYAPPAKGVAKKLETAEIKAEKKLLEEEELARLIQEQEGEDVEFETNYNSVDDEALVIKTRKKEPADYNISSSLSKLLDDVKWNLDEALTKLTSGKIGTSNLADIKYVEERIRNRDRNNNKLASVFKNADTALTHVIKEGTAIEKAIAKLILDNTSKAKRDAIKFETVLNGDRNFYKDGVITLTSTDTRIALHEFIHAVTVREMEVNPILKTKVEGLLGRVKMELLASGRFTQYQLDYIRKNNTSAKFKDNNPKGVFFGEQEKVAYGLINVREFMSQALSEPAMMDVLKSVKLENPKGVLKTLWDAIVSIVGEVLGISRLHHSALSEILTLSVEAMKQERVSTKSTGINEAMVSKITREFVEQEVGDYTTERPTSETLKEVIIGGLKSTERTFSDTVQKLYTSIADISVPLAEKVQRLDFNSLTALTRRVDETLEFDRKVKKLNEKEQKELFIYLNNFNAGPAFLSSLNSFLARKGMAESFTKTTKMLKDLYQEAETFGLNKYEEVENYFPRKVKDLEGLTSYLRKQEDWGIMDEALKIEKDRYLKKNGKEMSGREEADVLGRMLATGRLPASYLRNPTGTKQRNIKVVNAKMMDFYYSPIEALGMHIQEMTERIEINRMLGVTDMKNTKAEIKKIVKEIRSLQAKKGNEELIKTKSEELQKLRDSIPEMAAQIDNSIGDIAAKLVKERKITEDQQGRVKELIRARITEVGVGRKVSMIRQAALIGTLTQVGTGLRQLSDQVWSMYRNGVFNTLQAAINVATGKSIIKENFIDFQMPLKEFDSMNSMVDKVMKFSGIAFMDNIGKKISMEASQIASKKMTRDAFIKKWSYAYGEDVAKTGRVYDDIQEGVVNDEVKYLVTSIIAKDQPIFKSSQSRYQLQAGNARIFWFLKSYAISSANSFYNESIGQIRKGNVKEGLKNLATLGTLFVMLGAGSDWLVDMLYGRKPDLNKSAVDTLLSLILMSQYSVDKGKKDGFFRTFAGQILPPLNVLDFPTTDLFNLVTGEPTFKTLKLLPAVGSIAYNRMTDAGQKSMISSAKKDIYKEAVSGTLPSSDIAEVNSKIRSYNIGKPKDKRIAPITSGTIATARKKERQKNAK